jgi:hypothetical protein
MREQEKSLSKPHRERKEGDDYEKFLRSFLAGTI